MEEEKKSNVNVQGGQQGGQGGRHRKRRRRHGNGGNGGNGGSGGNVQNAQAAQTPQKAQPAQNGQNNKQKQGGNNGQKNRPQNAQNNQNNRPKNQNGGGRDKANDKNDKNDRRAEKQKDENRKDTYVYTIDGNLYINLTNKCSNACDFCVRNERDSYYGNYLWLRHGDPTVEKVIAALKQFNLSAYKEAVFCGFGEPTYKVDEMVALCDYFHEKGLSTRLNTNGQGNLINKRDIVPELVGKIDLVNVSLNASCVEKYQPICRSQFGENGFAAMIEFAKECKKKGVNCRFSIVDCIGKEEVEACKLFANSVGVPLYVRDYITDS